jgi:hypothetical protein
VGIEYDQDKLDELLRLTRENNRMLHAQRRNAWLGGIFKVIFWIVVIILPLWFYAQYVAPMMQGVLDTYQQIQGTGASAQAQVGQLNQYLEQFKSLYPGGL